MSLRPRGLTLSKVFDILENIIHTTITQERKEATVAPSTIILIAAISLVGLTFLFLLALYWIARIAFFRSGKDTDAFDGFDAPAMSPFKEESTERITRLLNEEYEDVYITSTKGGLRLHGRLYFRHGGAPFQVMAHGYRSNPYRDFSGGALEKLTVTADSNISSFATGAFEGASTLTDLWIYKTAGNDVMPPADFIGVSPSFKVHVPLGSDFTNHYYWSERGLTFVTDAN